MINMNDIDPEEMSKCCINCTEEEYSKYLTEATEGYDPSHEEKIMEMEKCKCDYIGCKNDATTSGAVYGHIKGSSNKDNFIHVNACDRHATNEGFFADR